MARKTSRRSVRGRARKTSRQSNDVGPPRSAVLYARVSSREQEREGFSIPAQRKLLQEYASRNGFAVVQEFVDVETAKQTGRVEFGKMVAYIKRKAPRPPAILVEKTDRIYRNLKDWVTLDETANLEIHLVKEGAVISEGSKSSEKFVHGIKVLMAKNYVDNLSEEVQKGMRHKAEEGHWPSSAPLGYLNRREGGKSYIVEDPERSPIIRKLFELYETGDYSVNRLAEFASQAGLRGKRGAILRPNTIHYILRNPIYAGEFYWAGVLYRSIDPTLVSRRLYDRVQARLDGHPYTRASAHDFPFRGLLTCGHCGAAITGEIHKGKYIYYRCAPRCTKEPFVRQEKLIEQFAEVVKRLKMTQRLVDKVVPALKESFRDIQAETQERMADARTRYDRIGKLIDSAYEDKLEGRIDDEFFLRKRAEWDRQRVEIQGELERLDAVNGRTMDMAFQVFELANSAYSLFVQRNPHEQRDLLDIVLSNCTLTGGVVTPTFRKPFDILAELAACDGDGGGGAGGNGGINSKWSGREDLNLRPLEPHSSALPDCATPRRAERNLERRRGFVKPIWELFDRKQRVDVGVVIGRSEKERGRGRSSGVEVAWVERRGVGRGRACWCRCRWWRWQRCGSGWQ